MRTRTPWLSNGAVVSLAAIVIFAVNTASGQHQSVGLSSHQDSAFHLIAMSWDLGDSTDLLTPHRTSADTGRMVWGRQSFASYVDPDYCDRAVLSLTRELSRVPDPQPYILSADTLPTAARHVARRCGNRFRVEDVAPSTLWGLMRLALAAGNDTQSYVAVKRLLTLALTPRERGWVLANAIQTYLTATPPRLTAANALLRHLDTANGIAVQERFVGRLAFVEFWQRFNIDSMRHHAIAATHLVKSMPPEVRNDVPTLFTPYYVLFDALNDAGDLEGQQGILARMTAEVPNWRGVQSGGLFVAQRQLHIRETLYGKQAVSLEGRHWFNSGEGVHPVAGKISLLIKLDHLCGAKCLQVYALLRHLHQRYKDTLDITVLTETKGYTLGTDVLSVNEELQRVSTYYLEVQQLPVALLVDERPIRRGPDGRVEYESTPLSRLFEGWLYMNAILIDQTRTIRWVGNMSSLRKLHVFESIIDRWIRETAPSSPATRQ